MSILEIGVRVIYYRKGHKLDEVLENMGMIVEGVSTTKAAYELAQQLEVEMPITETSTMSCTMTKMYNKQQKKSCCAMAKPKTNLHLIFRRKKMKVKKAVIPAAGLEHVSCRLPKRWQKKCYRLLINQRFNLL